MPKATIRDFEPDGKKVLIRVDFNVPLKDGEVTDDTRITRAVPTINYLRDKGARIILASHLGNPKTDEDREKLKMDPVADRLSRHLNAEVIKVNQCYGQEVSQKIDSLDKGGVLLLENTRFYSGEKKNDPEFSKNLANLADVFVNDAFGTAHREHASNVGVSKYLPAYAGFLMEKEIKMLSDNLKNPEHPFVAILGGAKVSSKIGVIENLLNKVDVLLIGGAMVFTFAKALGYETGNSLVEQDKIEEAKKFLKKAEEKGKKILLPVDIVASKEIREDSETIICDIKSVPEGYMGLDIGPKSIKMFEEEIKKARIVVWNGPMGVFEVSNFESGTREVAYFLSRLNNSITIIGGGDSAAAVNKFKLEDKMTHISTGGGASLEMLEGKILPGIKALKEI
ncbi:MAG: phosphoglycerate kinase [Candidatus Muiribacteriota bacterium]